MKRHNRKIDVPPEAFKARPVPDDPELLKAYFAQVASYEANQLRNARHLGRIGLTVGAIGGFIGLMGVGATASMAPLKTVIPLAFRVDNTTGAVERIYDVRGGVMEVTEADRRYFLWQYVRLRQSYSAPEAETNFNAVALMSSPQVQNEYAAAFKGTNPNSPQVLLGRNGSATLRWVSTSFLGPKLAQIRFVQLETKGGSALPPKPMVVTIAFEIAPSQISTSAMNINPLGIVITSYRADMESTQ